MNVWKLVVGIAMTAIGVLLTVDQPDNIFGVVFAGLPGALLVVSNVRLLIARPPQLVATSDGVAFAGGRQIPWRDIAAVYDASIDIRLHGSYEQLADMLGGSRGKALAVAFSFRRKRTLFRLPSTLWLTTVHFGDVKVSTFAADRRPEVLVAQFEALRSAAPSNAEPVPRQDKLAQARVVRRR